MYKKSLFIPFTAVFILALFLSVLLRFPKTEEKVYYSQDASYHVLLTAWAYDETPVSVHRFLPIVTLGDSQDKYIPWGDTLCDELGNYYYTSFSAAGFFFPYAFFKLFRLPFTLNSLYLFNSLLYLLCTFLVFWLFKLLFSENRYRLYLGLFAAALYAFQTETLHSQGAVYWSQSLFQAFFLLQAICFIKEKNAGFFLLSLFTPYLEWTGFVANAGFSLVFLFQKKWKSFFLTGFLTVAALGLFILHYALVLPFSDILAALYHRFFSRSITSAVGWSAFIKGYLCSYGLLFAAAGLLLLIVLVRGKSRQRLPSLLRRQKFIWLMLLFPVLENLLMQQHVVFYTYDRLKAVLPLLYLFLTCLECILTDFASPRRLACGLFAGTLAMACCNMAYYLKPNSFYSHPASYLRENLLLADYIKEQYPVDDSVIGQNNATRGYSNLLFHRGIYEYQNAESYPSLLNGRRYYIYLESPDLPFNIYQYTSAIIYDNLENEATCLTVEDGQIHLEPQ